MAGWGGKAGGPGFVGIKSTVTRTHRGRSHTPRDGIKRLCRFVVPSDEPRLAGRTEAIVIRDVVELLDKARGRDATHGCRVRTGLSTGTPARGLDLAEHYAQCAVGLRQSHVM